MPQRRPTLHVHETRFNRERQAEQIHLREEGEDELEQSVEATVKVG